MADLEQLFAIIVGDQSFSGRDASVQSRSWQPDGKLVIWARKRGLSWRYLFEDRQDVGRDWADVLVVPQRYQVLLMDISCLSKTTVQTRPACRDQENAILEYQEKEIPQVDSAYVSAC